MRKILTLALLLFLVGCGTQENTEMSTPETSPETETPVTEQPTEPEEMGMMYFTLSELAMYDGVQMDMMYVAVDGIVYDVTTVEAWSTGTHNGYSVGNDVTEGLNMSPHKESVLADLTQVGMLVEEFDLEMLSMYDGVQMEMMYIAVNGIVYDVTGVAEWSTGSHQGYNVGNDVTEGFEISPHAMATLEALTVVGKLK